MPEANSSGEGSSGGDGAAASGGANDKVFEGNKHKKLLRLLTVFAYLSTVSGTAFMLSLYYLFLWTPKVQLGGKALVQDPPPNTLALFYPEMAPQLSARVADEESTKNWQPSDRKGPSKPMRRTASKGDIIPESQVPATPQLTLPVANDAMDAYGKRREARSTLMETTTQQMPLTTKWGEEGTPRGPNKQPLNQGSTPAPTPSPTQRIKAKAAERDTTRHTTQQPHPPEVAVNA